MQGMTAYNRWTTDATLNSMWLSPAGLQKQTKHGLEGGQPIRYVLENYIQDQFGIQFHPNIIAVQYGYTAITLDQCCQLWIAENSGMFKYRYITMLQGRSTRYFTIFCTKQCIVEQERLVRQPIALQRRYCCYLKQLLWI